MHEYALAEAVVRAVARVADTENLTTVSKVTVAVGELQQIHRETFEFALAQVRPEGDGRFEATEFVVEIDAARLRCRNCEHAFGLAETGDRDADASEAIHFVPELAHAFMKCPACGSPDFELEEGRGVGITGIEGETPDA